METIQRTPVEVFYSCSASSDDAPLLQKLVNHLTILQHEGLISTWHRGQTIAGSIRQAEAEKHLKSAALILLLISSDFFASTDCYREMKIAMARHDARTATVIPILLRQCVWQGAPFAELEVLPTGEKAITSWNNRDDAWTNVVTKIRQVLDTLPGTITPGQPGPTTPGDTIKTLFLAANPDNTTPLAIDKEMRAIEQKVRMSDYPRALTFQSNWAVTPDDLLQLLNQHRPHVVHFSGHGSQMGLFLTGNDGQFKLVPTRALEALFSTLKGNIRLVFLNACYSHEQALALVKTIDCVIGMKTSIYDTAARTFSATFYRAIGFGRSLQEAFDQGKVALLMEGLPEEDLPELLTREGVDPARIVLISSPADSR